MEKDGELQQAGGREESESFHGAIMVMVSYLIGNGIARPHASAGKNKKGLARGSLSSIFDLPVYSALFPHSQAHAHMVKKPAN